MVLGLAGAILSVPVLAVEKAGGLGGYSQEDIAKMEKAVKDGKTISLGQGKEWTISATGEGAVDSEALLAKYEHLPGGKTMVAVARKIITMYRVYLDKIEAFADHIGL